MDLLDWTETRKRQGRGCGRILPRCFTRRPDGILRKEVSPMDPQTVVAVCAIFSVVLAIVSAAGRK